MTENDEIIEDIAGFTHDPLGFVLYSYPWGEDETELDDVEGPRVWQEKFFSALGDHLEDPKTRHTPFLYGVASGHGIGKAQHENSIIPTPNGDKIIKDISPGDYVFGSDGAPTEVLEVKKFINRPCFRVCFDDDTSVIVDENHDWDVRGRQERRKKSSKWLTMSTLEIFKKGVLRLNGRRLAKQWEIPTTKPIQGDIKEKYAYSIGVWIGDGSAKKGSYSKPYKEIAEKIESQNIRVNKLSGDVYGVAGLSFKLRELGLFSLRSYERYIPEIVWSWTWKNRFQLLSGLLDTDGECSKSGTIVYSTTSHRLIKDIMRLARSLGMKATQQKVKKAYIGDVRHRDCYRTSINIGDMDNPFSVIHKRKRVINSESRYKKRWISDIERVENADNVCLSVKASNGLYLANDYIVTHNSAAIGMLINWGLSTCEDCKVVMTSNTETQLRTKTMPEVSKWFRLAINSNWWKVTATAVFSLDKKHQTTWRADAVPWSKTNTEAFAGLHNKKKRLILIFDEASAIDDKVWEVAEGALTDEETEIIWVAFGNPTRNTGRFRECWRKFRHRWKTQQVDSRDVEGTNKQQIDQWIEDHGLNSDFVKVRVRGIFPSQSFKQFISTDLADQAIDRDLKPEQYNFAPKILTLDPAWEGDDELAYGLRQGNHFEILHIQSKNDNDLEVAAFLAQLEDDHEADAVFIDAGYGTGIYSAGKTMGRDWKLVWFGGASSDPGCINKRADMYKSCREWLREGGSISDPVLHQELISPETVPRGDGKIQIEAKKDMKSRGIPSGNRADALIISFAYPVEKKSEDSKKHTYPTYGHNEGWMG